MNRSWSSGFALAFLALALTAQAPPAGGPAGRARQIQLQRKVAPDAGSPEAPLLFCIGMHVEPLGALPSALAVPKEELEKIRALREKMRGEPIGPSGRRPAPDYHIRPLFLRHLEDLRAVAKIIEARGGKMTVQVQTPFTSVAAETGEPILKDLAAAGHEIALHFHEDAHLGQDPERLDAATWSAVMKEEIDWIVKAGGKNIRYWSGGNLYPRLLEAAAGAGLDVMSDHKNPRRQRTEETLLAIWPWRPAGGPTEDDVADFARHDPPGKIIFLPDGIFARVDHAGARRGQIGGEAAYFDFLTDGLELSLRAARKDRINVFHITVHPGEFRRAGKPFEVIDVWLREVVDPLAKAGKVRWATFSEMADAYIRWEKDHPGVDPRSAPAEK